MVSKDFNPQDFEDAEETLSFSDLPLHHSEDYSQEHESSSSDHFEFFSEDFTSNYYPTNDIIFCGKLIKVAEKKQSKEVIQPRITHHAKKSQIFPWKSSSFSSSSEKIQQQKRYNTCKSFPVMSKLDENRFDQRKRWRIPAKTRWNLFGVGVPGEMKLRDIKTRQNKRKPAAMFRYDNRKGEMVKNEERSKKLKKLWGLRCLPLLRSGCILNI